MNIIINARFLTQPISGVQRYAIECSKQIKKLYNDIIFVTPYNILHNDIANELGAIVIGTHTGHVWEQFDLPRYLKKSNNPPLLNLGNTAPLYYTNNYITIHDLAFYHHPEWNSKPFALWYNFMAPRIAASSLHIFTVSETIKQELQQAYKIEPAKISLTYNGLADSFIERALEGNFRKEKIILSVGTFNKRKNQISLIRAFLKSNIKNAYQLALVGDTHSAFAKAGITNQDLDHENIKVLYGISYAELMTLYEKAAINVSLSVYEGFGIPILEGLTMGCKTLCSDIPVYRELFTGYATYCPTHDIEAIVRSLEKMCATDSSDSTLDISELLEKYNYKNSARTIIERIGNV